MRALIDIFFPTIFIAGGRSLTMIYFLNYVYVFPAEEDTLSGILIGAGDSSNP